MTASLGFDPPATFSVVFSDGGREIDLGWVAVGRELRPKKLRSLIGKAVGVSASQISIYLIAPDGLLVAKLEDGLGLSAFASLGGSFLLATLTSTPKRSRKGRSRRIRVDGRSAEPSGKAILKRGEDDAWERGCEASCYDACRQTVPEDGKPAVCKVCEAAGLPRPKFHWCVYDTVVVGFRSRAGPVQRPTKA